MAEEEVKRFVRPYSWRDKDATDVGWVNKLCGA